MRKAVAGFWWSPASEGVSALVMTAAFFALGSGLGHLVSACAIERNGGLISAYLEQFLCIAQSDGLFCPDLFQFLWLSLRWPLAAFVLGFSALGLLALPLLSGLRGFLLSFAVGTFAQALGRRGLGIAVLLLGGSSLISVPIFLLVATQSFSASKALASHKTGQGRKELPYDRAYIFRCCLSFFVLLLSLLGEWYFVPMLLTDWTNILP